MPPELLKDDDDLPEGGVDVEDEKDTVVLLPEEGDGGSKGADKKVVQKGEGADDERLGADPEAPTEEEKERQREARRLRRKNARQWVKRDRLELNFLRGQNEQLEREMAELKRSQRTVTDQTQLGRIDTALTALKGRLSEIDSVIAAAVSESDGDRVVEANRMRDEVRDKITQLSVARERIKGSESEGREAADQEDAVREARKTALNNARIFNERHSWFDGESKDSRVVIRLDRELRAEGRLQDNTAAFWQELEKRMKDEIPHRFKKGANGEKDPDDDDDPDDEDDDQDERSENQNKARGGPQITSVGGKKPAGKGKTYVLSAARKQAMVDAGIWDDVPLRNKVIKRYMAYDQLHNRK